MKHLLFVFLIGVASAQQCRNSADRAINGRCFTLVNQQLSWQDARDWCHHRSPVSPSYLATVTDTTTANFLASYARSSFNTNEGFFWIGLFRNNASSRWQWDDGTPVTWTNFALQNSYTFVAESITNARFTAFTIDAKFNFICSYNPNAVSTGGTTEVPFSETPSTIATTADYTSPPDDTTCTSRTQPPTFLFAYSNDFDQQTILDTWNAFVDLEGQVNAQYSTFGSVRFDTKTQDSIQWNTNYKDVMSSIRNHLPDPSLGFGDSSTGSDVLNVLERYLNNGQIQVCGSNVMILLKRYPNTVDISRIVSIIRSHHAVVHVITSASPSGGTQSKTGYNLASKSNGLGAFEQDVHFSDTIPRFPLFATPFPIYTINVQVSGKGSIQLPLMSVPSSTYYYVSMTYQDHLPLDGFKKITLSWADDSFVETIDEANSREEGGTYTAGWSSFDAGTRSLTFDYEYSDSKLETLQIRISSDTPLNDWLPYAE